MEIIINKRIRQLREERRWTREELAKRVGVSYPTVWYWENGKKCPEVPKIAMLSDLFGVTVDYLYGRTDVRETARQ